MNSDFFVLQRRPAAGGDPVSRIIGAEHMENPEKAGLNGTGGRETCGYKTKRKEAAGCGVYSGFDREGGTGRIVPDTGGLFLRMDQK